MENLLEGGAEGKRLRPSDDVDVREISQKRTKKLIAQGAA